MSVACAAFAHCNRLSHLPNQPPSPLTFPSSRLLVLECVKEVEDAYMLMDVLSSHSLPLKQVVKPFPVGGLVHMHKLAFILLCHVFANHTEGASYSGLCPVLRPCPALHPRPELHTECGIHAPNYPAPLTARCCS